MPDTASNQRPFPQPITQARGVGFPLARLVAVISLFLSLNPSQIPHGLTICRHGPPQRNPLRIEEFSRHPKTVRTPLIFSSSLF
jgi:hypothetical protein